MWRFCEGLAQLPQIVIIISKVNQKKGYLMRNLYVVLDTETVTDARFVYDIGWIVFDAKGNRLDSVNYLVEEIVNSPLGIPMLSRDNFSRRKYPFYRDAMVFHSIPIKPLAQIAIEFESLAARYNAQNVIVCAYNAAFDISVLNQNCQWLYGLDFFGDEIRYLDIMTAAMGIICNTQRYVNYCLDNGFITDAGNVKTSAEIVYRYMTKNNTFEESHTALDDCEIESEILFTCKNRKKKIFRRLAQPIFNCPEWKAIQSRI